jgi:hypothetical protein
MNFSPNIDSYSNIEKEIENTLSAISNVSDVKHDIRSTISEDEEAKDVAKEVSEIGSEVDSRRQDAEKAAEKIKKSLTDLMQSDLYTSLDSFQKTANLFSANNLQEIFYDNYDSFPFSEWASLDGIRYNFGEVRSFFSELPIASTEDRQIYFYNLRAALSPVSDKEKSYFFKETLNAISKIDTDDRDKFISTQLNDNKIFKNTLFVLMLSDQLDSNYYDYSKWKPMIEEFIINQCSQEDSKKELIRFLLHDNINNSIFCERENRSIYYNHIRKIKMESFEKLIDLDIKLHLDLGNSLTSTLIEIAAKQYSAKDKSTDIIEKCEGIASYMMAAKLEQNLAVKSSSLKQMKI